MRVDRIPNLSDLANTLHDRTKDVTEQFTAREVIAFLKEVRTARQVWLDEYDPKAGSDCVTPFDQFLYGTHPIREADLIEAREIARHLYA
jgi:hypothetical protein